MKILFVADLHIKLGQKSVPIAWSKNRFSMFVTQLLEMQKKADVLIVGGDIFDKIPSMEELEVYFELIASISIPCLIYAGNHEMLKKDTTFLTNLKPVTERLNSLVTIIDDYYTTTIDNRVVDIIPYNKLKEFALTKNNMSGSLLCTHVRGEILPHVHPEIDLTLLDKWDIVLAGDLHSYSNSQRNILYPGSPYSTSFHRSEISTGAILLELKDLSHEWLNFELPQLLRKSAGINDSAEATNFHHTVYEVEGNLHELSQLDDNDLIEKIVLKRSQDIQLILDNDLTLLDEINEYLSYILKLDEKTITKILDEFNNNANKIK